MFGASTPLSIQTSNHVNSHAHHKVEFSTKDHTTFTYRVELEHAHFVETELRVTSNNIQIDETLLLSVHHQDIRRLWPLCRLYMSNQLSLFLVVS